MINVHPSLLPKYRGAAPVHRAVIAGDTETGVTIMRVAPKLDAGAMFATADAPDRPDETSDAVEDALAAARGAAAGRGRGRAWPTAPRTRSRRTNALATYAARADQGRRADRLDAAGAAHPRPRPRPVPLAARLQRHSTAAASSCWRTSPRDAAATAAPGTVLQRRPRRPPRRRRRRHAPSHSSSCSPKGGRPMPAATSCAAIRVQRRARASPAHDRHRRASRRFACSARWRAATRSRPRSSPASTATPGRSARSRARHRDRHRHAALAAGARRRHRGRGGTQRSSRSTATCVRHPAPQPVSAAAPRSRAGVGRRGRRRVAHARRRPGAAPPASSTASCARCSAQPRPPGAAAAARARRAARAALAYLGITHSHPDWLVARWLDRYGFDARGRLDRVQQHHAGRDAARQPARDVARRAPRRSCSTSDERRHRRPSATRPMGSIVAGRPAARRPRAASRSRTRRRSSCRCCSAPGPATRVLDLCASPGGKATALAADMEGRGPDRGLRRAGPAHAAARGRPCATAARRTSALVQVGSRDGGAVRAGVRPRARGRALFGPRHRPPRSRHPLASHRSGARRVRGLPADAARTAPRARWPRRPSRLRHVLERARGERGRGGRASSPRIPGSGSRTPARSTRRGCARRSPTRAACCARCPSRTGSKRSSPPPRPIAAGCGSTSWYDQPFMPLGTRVWKLGKLLLLAGALGLTFLVFFGIAMRAALKAREVRVPGLVGLDRARSHARARPRSGWRCASTTRGGPTSTCRPGTSCSRSRRRATLARQQRGVRVWVSSGPRATIVPQLAAQTERTARIRLEQGGLDRRLALRDPLHGYPADTVDRAGSAGRHAGARRLAARQPRARKAPPT